MITAWTLSALLLCFQVVADVPPSESSPANQESERETQEAIDRAVQLLDSDSFQTREKATKEIWSFGERAKPALQQVIEKGSLEARSRATSILTDIELDITPETTVETARMLRGFQASSQQRRVILLSEMLKKGDFDNATKLIDRIDDSNTKRNLFQNSFKDNSIVTKLIQSESWGAWVQKASQFDPNIKRHEITIDWIENHHGLRNLDSEDKRKVIESLLAQEPDDAGRFVLTKKLLECDPFLNHFNDEEDIDFLLQLVDFPNNPAGTDDLLLILIDRRPDSTFRQLATVEKIMRSLDSKEREGAISEVRIQLLIRLLLSTPPSKQLTAEIFTQLCAGLTETGLTKLFGEAIQRPEIAGRILSGENFRSLMGWTSGLPSPKRDSVTAHLGTLLASNQVAGKHRLSDPATFQTFWGLIEAIAQESTKQNEKIKLVSHLALDSFPDGEQKNELIQLILTTQTPQADAAFILMLDNTAHREQIFEHIDDVKIYFARCAKIDLMEGVHLLGETLTTLLDTQSLQKHLSEPSQMQWLLGDYLPPLSQSQRGEAIKAICQTSELMETMVGTSEIDPFLDLAKGIEEPIARVTSIALILHYERILELGEDDPKVKLLEVYRDESIVDEARLAFIQVLLERPKYRNWLIESGRIDAFLGAIEGFADRLKKDSKSLIFSRDYITLIASQNRLGSWLTGFKGDIQAESLALSRLMEEKSLLSVEFLDENMKRLTRIVRAYKSEVATEKAPPGGGPFGGWGFATPEADKDAGRRKRAEFLAVILLSPNSLLVHQRQNTFENLFRAIGDERDILIQRQLMLSLSTKDAVKAIAESNKLNELINMIKGLSSDRSRAATWILGHPVLLKHLVDTQQVDFLFQMISRHPQSQTLVQNRVAVDILINHGYVDRILESAEKSAEAELLIAKLVGSSVAIKLYTTSGRVNDLVKAFERLNPGMHRDEALTTLFKYPETIFAIFKERGVDQTMKLIDLIQYPAFVTRTRSNALLALSELETLPETKLRQLLVDIQGNGSVGMSDCLKLVQGSAGEQLIAAGLLPEIKALFSKVRKPGSERVNKSLDNFYSSEMVIKYLNENERMEEFMQHAKSIIEPNEVSEFARQSIAHQQGCRILLTSTMFTDFAAITENLSDYSQNQFWQSFCANQRVIDYLSYSDDVDAMIQYLTKREQFTIDRLISWISQSESLDNVVKNKKVVNHIVECLPTLKPDTRNRLATNLSRHSSALWTMVETDQWGSIVAIIDSGKNDPWPRVHWDTSAGYQGGLISALISLDQYAKVSEVLNKSAESDWHRAWVDLWLRASRGTIIDDIKHAEANAATLSQGRWSWLSWAHRAQGEYTNAMNAARNCDRHSFQAAIAIEQGDWPEVVSLLKKSAAIQAYIHPPGQVESELEHQAMLMVAHLYAQQHDQLLRPSEAITKLRSESDNPHLQSRCCDALLLGHQFESTLSFLDQRMIPRALRFRLQQGKHVDAIKMVKWDPADPRAFLSLIRSPTGNPRAAMESTVDLLRALNLSKKHDDMRILHNAVIAAQPIMLDAPQGPWQPNYEIIEYAKQLYRHELFDLYWSTLEHINAPPPIIAMTFMVDSQDDVERTLRHNLPQVIRRAEAKGEAASERQATIDTMRVADKVIRTNSVTEQQLDAWVDLVTVSSETGNRLSNDAIAVGIVCLRQGRIDDAKRILIPLEENHWVASLVLARDAWKRKDWDQAAVHYDRLYRNSRARIEGLYFSGLAMTRVGRVDEGEAAMAMARKAAFHPRTLLQMGVESLKIGEAEIGKAFFEKVVRLALPHDPAQREAIGHLKACASSPEEVIRWSQQWQMLQTRYYYGYGDQAELLEVPWAMQGAMAEQSFANEDWPAVDRALKVCFEIKPGETKFFDGWIERLDKAGQTDLAKVWKEKSGVQAALND